MEGKALRILLVGEESAGIQTLKHIATTPHEIVAVMSSSAGSGGDTVGLWGVASKMGYRTWPADLVKNESFADSVRDERVDILLNVHSLYVAHRGVLSVPPIGCFNVHPGPLPRYAGLNAVSWAIFNGESTHGVTIHRMAPDVDAGPIAYQQMVPIDTTETAISLSLKCVKAGLPLIRDLLEVAAINPAEIPNIPQDLNQRTFFGRKPPMGGVVSWMMPARSVVDLIRACDYAPFSSPWGLATSSLHGESIAILKARTTGKKCTARPGEVFAQAPHSVLIACNDEWVDVLRVKYRGQILEATEVVKSGDRLGTQTSKSSTPYQ